jgi:polysaccharide biosynthesis protein PslH
LKILLVTARYPWPARRGDQLRTAQLLELLAPEHQLTLLAPAAAAGQSPAPPLPPGTELVTYRTAGGWDRARRLLGVLRALWRGLPLQSGLFFSPDLSRQLRRLAPAADLAVLQLVRLAVHRKDLGPTPLVLDLVDDLALNFARRSAVDRRWLRPALAAEARLLGRAQRRLAGQAAGVLLVSERDRRELVSGLPASLAERISTVRLAVEAGPLAPAPAPGLAPSLGDRLVFTGNLGYFVNVDAICWWLREVWPAVAASRPGLRLLVAGDRPARAVQRAVARAAAPGWKRRPRPEEAAVALVESATDLRAVLAGATAALAPMRCGSGVPIKVLEAWSAGVPVIASPWAAAGTTGVPGEDLLIAQSAGDWVAAIGKLLDDPATGRRLAHGGRQRLAADYSRRQVKQQLLAAIAAASR